LDDDSIKKMVKSKLDLENSQIASLNQVRVLPMQQVPKTLVLIPDLNTPGGVSNYYKTLKLDSNRNITYFPISRLKPQGPAAAVLRLFGKYCKFSYNLLAKRIEVVVVNPSLDMGKSFHRDMVFIMISHLLNKKTIVFFRGWFDPYEEKIKKSKWKLFLFNISYAKANKYVVLGDIFKKKLIGLGVPEKTEFFIETTVADSSYLKELDLPAKYLNFEKEINFLFLSRIEKEKGIHIAIDAFKEFCVRFPDREASLIIAGDGPDLPAVKAYVEEKGIPKIKFLGHVNAEKKKDVLLKSHVMIFPSYTEGLPNVILEGMLYGMPIVARATGGIPEIVKQNINGFVTESFDFKVFADFLEVLASDVKLYENMAETNHRTALQKFTSEKVKERMIGIYEGCRN
jgi:glycosyltransferase involved in cell wall biosynthesis